MRGFRFGVQARPTGSAAEWLQTARDAEAMGFDVITLADHFNGRMAPLVALTAAAAATTRLRLGTLVLCNDFRHPVPLANELATLDLLSGGRLEIGLGAGWLKTEYEAAGITYDRPSVRVDRFTESVRILKGLFKDEPLTFEGRHYTIRDLQGAPRPVQRPHPPFYIGAGGRRMLSIAAREADTVGIHYDLSEGDFTRQTMRSTHDDPTARKIQWVREAAGARFEHLELAVIVFEVIVTPHVRAAAERVGTHFGLTPEEVLQAPNFLIGTEEGIASLIQERRESHGISYLTVTSEAMTSFAPILERLRG